MIINNKKFINFCKENFTSFINNIIPHPLNKDNVGKWILSHKEEEKICARLASTCFRNISISETLDVLNKICEELILLQQNRKLILFLSCPTEPSDILIKSNFFISVLLYYIASEKKLNFSAVITEKEDLNELKIDPSNAILVIPDDCSYSGSQLSGVVYGLANKNNKLPMKVFLVLVAISQTAKRAFNNWKNEIIFSSHTILFDSIFSSVKNSDSFKMLTEDEKKDIIKNLPDLHAVYFDFKIPDTLSIISSTFLFGYYITGIKPLQPLPLISGCEDNCIKIFTDPNFKEVEDPTDYNNICPYPIYKYKKYTYNQEIIEDLIILEN